MFHTSQILFVPRKICVAGVFKLLDRNIFSLYFSLFHILEALTELSVPTVNSLLEVAQKNLLEKTFLLGTYFYVKVFTRWIKVFSA